MHHNVAFAAKLTLQIAPLNYTLAILPSSEPASLQLCSADGTELVGPIDAVAGSQLEVHTRPVAHYTHSLSLFYA